jgi:hypothetical protein
MTRKRSMAVATAVSALTVMLTAGGLSAAAGKSGPKAGSAAILVGSWDVTVTLPSPPPAPPVLAKALATFSRDGTTIESAAAPGNVRSASHGGWKHIGPRLFSVTRIFFRFNPQTGAFVGTQKINATVRVARGGQSFAAVSVSEQYDPAGNLTGGGIRATAIGKRIGVETIPDRP